MSTEWAGRVWPGSAANLDYLEELGVTYVHLMPLLKKKEIRVPGENDGGYAVSSIARWSRGSAPWRSWRIWRGEAGAAAVCGSARLRLQPHCRRPRVGPPAKGRRSGGPRTSIASSPTAACPTAYQPICARSSRNGAKRKFLWVRSSTAGVWSTFYAYQWDLNSATRRCSTGCWRRCCPSPNRGSRSAARRVPFHLEGAGHRLRDTGPARTADPAVNAARRRWRAGADSSGREAIVHPDQVASYVGRQRSAAQLPSALDASISGRCWRPTTPGWPAMRCAKALRPFRRAAAGVNYVRGHDDYRLGLRRRGMRRPSTIDGFATAVPATLSSTGRAPRQFRRRALPFQGKTRAPATPDRRHQRPACAE